MIRELLGKCIYRGILFCSLIFAAIPVCASPSNCLASLVSPALKGSIYHPDEVQQRSEAQQRLYDPEKAAGWVNNLGHDGRTLAGKLWKNVQNGGNQQVLAEIEELIYRYVGGNLNPGIGTRQMQHGYFELRGHKARVILVRDPGGKINVVAKLQGHEVGEKEYNRLVTRLIEEHREWIRNQPQIKKTLIPTRGTRGSH